MKRRIAIIGGGLAGIAAAVRLAESDCQPILIETRKRLGGRATSLVDPRSGETIDNCQHVLLGCCTNLIDLYDRLGVLELIEWHRTLHWMRGGGGGEIDQIKAGWLPAPLHLARSFARMRLFSRAEKRHIARCMWRMIRLGARGRLAWRSRTFAAFLEESRQPPELVRSFWNTVIVSACNLPCERVNAAYGLQVFQEGFLANRWSYTMGVPAAPLADLYTPATTILEAAGGEVRLGCSAQAIGFDGARVTGVVTDDGLIESAAVITAVPFDRLAKLASNALRRADARLQHLDAFEVSPILGVHLWFDQPIMDQPHLVLVEREVQWLFNKGINGRPSGRQHIHAVISAADAWMDLDEAEIVERVLADVHAALPRSVGLRPVLARSIKERRATFAATRGVDAHRPPAAARYASGGGVKNLFLAGDWCDTGWPATMEGAVRSGYAAAAAAVAGAGAGDGGLVEDVPAGLLARLLGLR